MAKHQKRGRRRNSKFFVYPVETTLSLGSLSADAVLLSALTAFGITKVRLISADLTWSRKGATVNEGPVRVGLANNNLAIGEVAEKLDARPTSQTDIIAMERSRRPVRDAGAFQGENANETLNDGKVIRTKLGFVLDEGAELSIFVRNKSGASLTTGGVVQVQGKLYLAWI